MSEKLAAATQAFHAYLAAEGLGDVGIILLPPGATLCVPAGDVFDVPDGLPAVDTIIARFARGGVFWGLTFETDSNGDVVIRALQRDAGRPAGGALQ